MNMRQERTWIMRRSPCVTANGIVRPKKEDNETSVIAFFQDSVPSATNTQNYGSI
jgi:hypothetical protein